MKRNMKQVMEQVDLYVKNDVVIKNRNGEEGVIYNPNDILRSTVAVIEEGEVSKIYYNGMFVLKNLYL